MNFENQFEKEKNKEPENSPVPQGVDEEYFWEVVKILAGSQPGTGEQYKNGSIKSFHAGMTKTGEYKPFMETAITQAQKVVLDPESPLSKKNLKNLLETDFQRKRDALSDAYGQEFSPDQTHADLGDEEEPTRLD